MTTFQAKRNTSFYLLPLLFTILHLRERNCELNLCGFCRNPMRLKDLLVELSSVKDKNNNKK